MKKIVNIFGLILVIMTAAVLFQHSLEFISSANTIKNILGITGIVSLVILLMWTLRKIINKL